MWGGAGMSGAIIGAREGRSESRDRDRTESRGHHVRAPRPEKEH